MLSIDIGKINLGFAIYKSELVIGLLNITENTITCSDNEFQIEFNKLKVPKQYSIVVYRAMVMRNFIDLAFVHYELEQLVIERQSQYNSTAMELEYLITGLSMQYTENITIFNPVNKFTWVGLEYNVKNKAHKKLSINVVTKLIQNNQVVFNYFSKQQKQDDLADSIYMLFLMRDKESVKKLISTDT